MVRHESAKLWSPSSNLGGASKKSLVNGSTEPFVRLFLLKILLIIASLKRFIIPKANYSWPQTCPKKLFLRKFTTLLPQLCRNFLTHAVKMPTRCGTIFQGNFQVKTSADSYLRAKTAQKWVENSCLIRTIFSYLPKTIMLFSFVWILPKTAFCLKLVSYSIFFCFHLCLMTYYTIFTRALKFIDADLNSYLVTCFIVFIKSLFLPKIFLI